MEKLTPIAPQLTTVNPVQNAMLHNVDTDKLKDSTQGFGLTAATLLVGLIGAAAGAITTGIVNRKNRKATEEANELSWQRTLELQQYQNEYNSPAETMKRLEAAGLNPNLIYQNGAATTAASNDSYQAQASHRNTPDVSSMFNMLMQFLQYRDSHQLSTANAAYQAALARKTNVEANIAESTQGDKIRSSAINTALLEESRKQKELLNAYESGATEDKLRKLRAEADLATLNVEFQKNKNKIMDVEASTFEELNSLEIEKLRLNNKSGQVAIERALHDLKQLQRVDDFNYEILRAKADLSWKQVEKINEEIDILVNRGASTDEVLNLLDKTIENPETRQYVKAAYYILGQVCGFGIKLRNASKNPVYNKTEYHKHTGGTVVNSYKNNQIKAN